MDEFKIWQTARRYIRKFGKEAEPIAWGQADNAIERGDAERLQFWERVMAAIRSLHKRGE